VFVAFIAFVAPVKSAAQIPAEYLTGKKFIEFIGFFEFVELIEFSS
jgi:hypothetical protein